MNRQNSGEVELTGEEIFSLMFLLLLAAIMWFFGGLVTNGVDNFFRFGPNHVWTETTLPGIELTIVPLTAFAAVRWRFGVDRILALRGSRVGPILPLLMAASLFGLVTYLVATWISPQTMFGLQLEFGPLRWLGTVLAAVFIWVCMPLFPQVSATLAGMIAGPALFAIIGYSFFGSCMPEYVGPGIERNLAWGLLIVSPLATLVWAGGALWLWARARTGTEMHAPSNPLHFAVWSGAIMLALSLIGTLSFTAC